MTGTPTDVDYEIPLSELTTGAINGTGVFDELMKVVKLHVNEEYKANRIKGPEYASVYLGALQNTLNTSLEFLLQQQKAALEAENIKAQTKMVEAQILKIEVEKDMLEAQLPKIAAEIELAQKEVDKITAEITLLGLQEPKLEAEVDYIEAQILKLGSDKLLTDQQKTNLTAEAANIPKQGLLLDAQKQNIEASIEKTDSEKTLIDQQKVNLTAEAANIPKQGLLLDSQKLNIDGATTKITSEKLVLDQQKLNLVAEALNIPKQGARIEAEKDLLTQKKLTELAQINGAGVTVDSVIGRQNALYQAQTEGFERDAEQKAAKIMIDTWNVRRTTDEATVADSTNNLNDATIGKFVTRLASGVSVTP